MMGEQLIALPQQAVWDALNDPEILKQCIPGCESVEKVSDDEYRMTMVAAVGPVKAKFTGKLTIVNPVPPDSYALAFEGTGGVAGFGKGTAEVSLTQDSDTVTLLTYKATATVGGKIAQIGSRHRRRRPEDGRSLLREVHGGGDEGRGVGRTGGDSRELRRLIRTRQLRVGRISGIAA